MGSMTSQGCVQVHPPKAPEQVIRQNSEVERSWTSNVGIPTAISWLPTRVPISPQDCWISLKLFTF